MSRVQHRASLHEKAVQRVARGEHVKPKVHRATKQKGAMATVDIKVRPDVWVQVRALGADPRHIQIVSATEVVVWNHPAPWPGEFSD